MLRRSDTNPVGCLFHGLGPFDCKSSPGCLDFSQSVVCGLELMAGFLNIRVTDKSTCNAFQSVTRLMGGSEEGAVSVAPGLSAPLCVVNSGLGSYLLTARPPGYG